MASDWSKQGLYTSASDSEIIRAAVTVKKYATSSEDEIELMGMLGLDRVWDILEQRKGV